MTYGIFGESFIRPRMLVPALALTAVLALGFGAGPAWAERGAGQPEAAAKPDHQPLFAALDQWMSQNTASYTYDPQGLRDPFMPIPAIACGVCGDPGPTNHFTQLKLVAITMVGDGPALASFEDGFGASYILRVGDRLGPNQQRVVKISASTVTVEEPIREPGQTPRLMEIKLPTPGQTAGLTRSGQTLQIQRADSEL
jgi:Tfp pilus assembly protein PilP